MCDKIYTIDDIKSALKPVFISYNINKAVLFGSYVKGLANEKSDVDLLLDSGLKGLKFVGLIEDVRTALDKEVDVFDVAHIIPNSKISNEINRDGVLIYERWDNSRKDIKVSEREFFIFCVNWILVYIKPFEILYQNPYPSQG